MLKFFTVLLFSFLLICSPVHADDYTPTVGDIVLTVVPLPLTLLGDYNTVRELCPVLANADLGGYHLDCDGNASTLYWHAEFVNPDTWATRIVEITDPGYPGYSDLSYEVWRLGNWGDWQAAVNYQQWRFDNRGDSELPKFKYRAPVADWEHVRDHGCLPEIDNQRHPDQTWYQYFHINSSEYDECYFYCISLTFDCILHGWYKGSDDPQGVVNYCNQNRLSFFKNTLGGQMHAYLESSAVKVYPEPCECDLNTDGVCDMQDWLIFGEDWGRTDCTVP